MAQDNQQPIQVHTPEAFMLFAGCMLPAGEYALREVCGPSPNSEGGDQPRYEITLTVGQLRAMGQTLSNLDDILVLDVTNHVLSGRFVRSAGSADDNSGEIL